MRENRKIRKLTVLLLVLILSLSLVACQGEEVPTTLPAENQEEGTEENMEEVINEEKEVAVEIKRPSPEEIWEREIPPLGTQLKYQVIPFENLDKYAIYMEYQLEYLDELRSYNIPAFQSVVFDATVTGNHSLLYVFLGERSTGGYSLLVEEVVIEEHMDKDLNKVMPTRVTRLKEVTPGKGDMVTQAFTNPFIILEFEALPIMDKVFINGEEVTKQLLLVGGV